MSAEGPKDEPKKDVVRVEAAPVRGGDFASLIPGRPELPHVIAGYRLMREMPGGGMGLVYEAEDLRLKRKVAFKMIRLGAFASGQEMLRFHAEAELAAQLSHPNIVPIYDVNEVGGVPFFTMRFIRGQSLAERLAQGGALMPAREAVTLMAKVARAVHHAHERGVLHRDLKPGNVLLDGEGEPYLSDFGLAKLLNADAGLTRSQEQLGTPHYMSPEQAAGRTKEITTASDIWALGVILYQMLMGALPFAGDSGIELMRNIIQSEFRTLDLRVVDADLATILGRCLEKESSKRPPSAAFLADELERWLRGEAILSRRISALERLWKWGRRRRAAAAAILITSVITLGVIGTASRQAVAPHRDRDATRRALQEKQDIAQTMAEALGELFQARGARLEDGGQKLKALSDKIDAAKGDDLHEMQIQSALAAHVPEEHAGMLLRRALAAGRRMLDPEDARLWELRARIVQTEAGKAGSASDEGRSALLAELGEIHAWMHVHLGPQHPRTLAFLNRLQALKGKRE